MRIAKKHVVMLIVGIVAVVSTATSVENSVKYRNLQVLPKNIKSVELNKIMYDEFEDGLGVSCNYCHSPDKSDPSKLDYANDAKPEKKIARVMMRMTLSINKEYFFVKQPEFGSSVMAVTCNTCHSGQPRPSMPSE